MKEIIINTCYGGISSEMAKNRENAKHIDMVKRGKYINEKWEHLTVAQIPDEATDYYIDEYDGLETLYYIINGKIEMWDGDEVNEDGDDWDEWDE